MTNVPKIIIESLNRLPKKKENCCISVAIYSSINDKYP